MKPLLSLRGQTDFEAMVRLANRAKECGFWGVALSEDLENCSPDALLTIAALSQRCPKIGFMTNVINQFSRHPVSLAAAAISCVDLLGDRFILGLGPGSPSTSLALRLNSRRPLARLKEVVQVVRGLADSRNKNGFSIDGEHFKINSARLSRERDYALRIFIPGIQDVALRFAATYGDGIVLSNFSSLAYIKHARSVISEVKQLSELQCACNLTFIPSSDVNEGIKFARPFAERYLSFPRIGEALLKNSGFDPAISAEIRRGNYDHLSNEIIETMAVIGTRDKLADRLASMEKLGIEYPIIATDPSLIKGLVAERISW